MSEINVQFTDNTEKVIQTYFSSPQDPSVYDNLGTITTDDARWKAYFDAIPFASMSGLPSPTGA